MRHFILALSFLLVVFGVANKADAAETWKPRANWNLVWADEFKGTHISATNWTYDLGASGWGNKELQCYTNAPANAYIENGELVIQAIKNGTNYTSARLKTQGKHSWKYGKVAARIRLPYGQGMWPALWMLGDNIKTVGWPR